MHYSIHKRLLQFVIWVPTPVWFFKFLKFFIKTKSGENFGDFTINGEYKFLQKHGPLCKVIFDVGAHTGTWSEVALDVNPTAEIHCFEPIKSYYNTLVNQPYANRLICSNIGFSDKIHKSEIFHDTMSLYDRPEIDIDTHHNKEFIDLSTIDVYCETHGVSHIDLLKMDAEGHDFAILTGAKNMINQELIYRVQFEYGNFNIYSKTLLRDFFTFFESKPYVIYLILPKGLKRIDKYDYLLENFVYKNFVALHHTVME